MSLKQKFDPNDIANAFSYIESYWSEITRTQTVDEETLIGLPHPYVVPSSDISNGFVYEEMYYWDSYFVAQGLRVNGKLELAESMLENLIYMIHRFGMMPNSSRYYHMTHSQPPILTSYILDVYNWGKKSESWLRERIEIAEREYKNVWTASIHPHFRNMHMDLSRYYDIHVLNDLAEAESGWDMTTRFDGRCLDYLPIDLNCLLYKYEIDISNAYKIFGDKDTSELWQNKSAYRAEHINELMWDEEAGFYFDYDFRNYKRSEVWSLAGMYPLWCGLASHEQAKRLVANLQKFSFNGGLVATTQHNNDHRPFNKQWAYPNAWAPLQWIVTEGLNNYGYNEKAEHIARLWINSNLNYFKNFGIFREAYNAVSPLDKPLEGVYPSQIGFGWTNGVFLDLAKKYLDNDELELV
jgi:alpha,alpha-trehalase